MSELPAGWAETSLGAIGSVQSGMGFPLEMQGQTEGVYPVYKVGDVSRGVLLDGGILRRSTNYVDAEAAAVLKGHIFPKGSILFAKIGEALRLNRRAIIFREGLADNNVMGFKAAQGIDDGFLYHFLRTQDLASLSRSTTIPSIRKSDVEDITISLPPLAEQKRIAQKLDALLAQVDTLKARIDAIPALLKRFRRSILKSACSGELTADWRDTQRIEVEEENGSAIELLKKAQAMKIAWSKKENKHNEAKRVGKRAHSYNRNRHSEPLPQQWAWANLEDAALMVVDCHNKTAPYADTGIPLIRTPNVRDGRLIYQDLKFITGEFNSDSQRC
ncbi:restriction endonuclease subunit S [Xanthomonas oryzae]|uniref:restriction endonuclease subunit S n=1 Tax=Xanthomonas oryzae TaxID=347 RepID=UPI000949D9FC|nr:restriction endonuclease subunit S [Xanthomonas oryzae]